MAEGEVFQKVGIVKRLCETRFAGWDFRTCMFDGVLLRSCTRCRAGQQPGSATSAMQIPSSPNPKAGHQGWPDEEIVSLCERRLPYSLS
jgi:hypothetical protein